MISTFESGPLDTPPARRLICEICGSETLPAGEKTGTWRRRSYCLRTCPACHFSFVENPDTDFANIYNADYYAGKGADPFIDYEFESHNRVSTIRRYEWSGVAQIVSALGRTGDDSVFLDFGCGNGGLVAWMAEQPGVKAYGYDTASVVQSNRSRGIAMVDDEGLVQLQSRCDIVTAIEVLEHVMDPIDTLRRINGLLKPGGLFFFTTGNAKPFRGKLENWAYVYPEIHVSFFEPETMDRALRTAGFDVEYPGFIPGYADIVTYKVLKGLRVKRLNPLLNLVPWNSVSRIVNRRHGVSQFPVGRKRS